MKVAAAMTGKDFNAIRFETVSLVIVPPKIFEHPILQGQRLSVPQMGHRNRPAALLCRDAAKLLCCGLGGKAILDGKTIYVGSE